MHLNLKRLVAVTALLFLASCVSAPKSAPGYARAPSAIDGHANLYIYRHRAPPYIYHAKIYVDDRLVVKLPEEGYTVLPVTYGKHTIKVVSFDWPDVTGVIDVKDSSELFVKFSGGTTSEIVNYKIYAELMLPDAAIAEAEMQKCCRLIQPLDGDE